MESLKTRPNEALGSLIYWDALSHKAGRLNKIMVSLRSLQTQAAL